MGNSNGAMEITTIIGCQMACKYCPQDKLLKNYGNSTKKMSFENYKICLDKIPNTVRIDFSGMSEPWLNEKCTDMLLYANLKGYKIAVYTTLVGMSELDFQKIKNIKYDCFVIHAPDEENNSHIPITKEYLQLLKTVLDSKIACINFHGKVHPEIVKLIPNIHKFMDCFDRAGNINFPHIKHQHLHGSIKCGSADRLINRNVLLPDGRVLLCCMDYSMKHILGNLLINDYQSILNSIEAHKIRDAFDDEAISLICRFCHVACPK